MNQNFGNSSFMPMPVPMAPNPNEFSNPMQQKDPNYLSRKTNSSSNSSKLLLPALILLLLTWIIHTIATFIPYWATYSGIDDSRAGLWSARNVNFTSVQNFYFPDSDEFTTLESSLKLTGANVKGYLITVQFLMTFNFCLMFLVLVLLIVEYISLRQSGYATGRFLFDSTNSYDTGMKFAVLVYIFYVLGAFEFAAWITYVSSRHDNNWKMHASFALTVIASVFLVVVFIIFVMELLNLAKKIRRKWQYWYGPYVQWAFFIHLTAELLTLLVLACPEWAYRKNQTILEFAEIGLFKQCYLSSIYKDEISTSICTLSHSPSNQAWVNTTQAFMLMTCIFGGIILVLAVIFRREFRHNEQGYVSDRFAQPSFSFIVAGLIFLLCFTFSLIGVAVFGSKVFPESITVNWAYIVAVLAMFLFLVATILVILDALHSERQSNINEPSSLKKLLFPAPLNQRVLMMDSSIKPKQAWQSGISMQPTLPQQGVMPQMNMINAYPFYGQPPMIMPMTDIFQQTMNQPQWSPSFSNFNGPYDYGSNSMNHPDGLYAVDENAAMMNLVQQQMIQQQQLDYNHERLLERFHRLTIPKTSTFYPFGSSSLPGRNYDDYLSDIGGDLYYDNSLAWLSRNRVYSSIQDLHDDDDDELFPIGSTFEKFDVTDKNDPNESISGVPYVGNQSSFMHEDYSTADLMPIYQYRMFDKNQSMFNINSK